MPAVARRSEILTGLRRYFEVVLLCAALAAAAAAAFSYRSPTEYTGTATFFVPSGHVGDATIVPFDAERLGRVYTVVIVNDRALLNQLSNSVHRSADSISGRTTATSLPNSAAIRVQYRGSDRSEVRAYFDALTQAITSNPPTTVNIQPETIRLLRVDSDIPKTGGGTPAAGVVGALCGLLIGIGIASYLHQATPRVTDARDLREDRGPVVLDIDGSKRSTVEALAHRVAVGLPSGSDIAVVGLTPKTGRHAEKLAAHLASVPPEPGVGGASAGTAHWVPARFGEGAERLAQQAARTVLVVSSGARPALVADRLAELRDLGVDEVVVAVTGRKFLKAAAPEPYVSTPES